MIYLIDDSGEILQVSTLENWHNLVAIAEDELELELILEGIANE